MYSSNFRWGIPSFLGAAVLLALYIVASPGAVNDWLLDPLTALVSIVTILAACSQVANAAYDRRSNRIWQAIVTVLVLVSVAQCFDALSDKLGEFLGADDFDDFLILGIAPLMLGITSRFNPALKRARAAVWAGFAIQVGSTALDFSGAVSGSSHNPVVAWSVITDFAEFVSLSLYLIAVFLIIIDTGRAIGILEKPAQAEAGSVYTQGGRSIRDHVYPPPFVFGWFLPSTDTAAGRVHRLCNQAMWPSGDMRASARNLWLIASWPLVAAIRAMSETSKQGGELSAVTGKSSERQFWEQLSLALRHRIPPKYYYTYELYRAEQRRNVEHYLLRWETKEVAYRLLYPVETDHFKPTPLKDKEAFARHCVRHNLSHVPVLALFDGGQRIDGPDVLPAESLFLKPVRGKGGSGAERWRYLGNDRYLSDDDIELDGDWLLDYIKDLSRSVPYLVQPMRHNHLFIHDLSASALSTVRILTARTEAGEFEVTNAAFRMSVSRNSAVDNFHAGGIAAAVDVSTGRLGCATDLGGNGPAVWHQHHPVTGGVIASRQLPMWQEARDLVLRAHRAFDDYALIGWDVALLDDGPALVEGNRGPDVDIIQRTGRFAIAKTRFGDLLAHNLEQRLRRRRPAASGRTVWARPERH